MILIALPRFIAAEQTTYPTMGKISNFTNSHSPQAINSRVFVGNLNTFSLSKASVEQLFQRYGHIVAISMHKGYAFVQYVSEFEARCAVAGEDQRLYANQPIGESTTINLLIYILWSRFLNMFRTVSINYRSWSRIEFWFLEPLTIYFM